MLKNKNKRMAEAVELAKIGFYSYLFDGTVLSADKVTYDFFELEGFFESPESLIGVNIETIFIYTGAKGKVREEIRVKGKVFRMEYSFKTLKGTEKCGIHNSYMYKDEDTGKEAIQVCFYDITEQKKSEEEKKTLESRLHQSEKLNAIGQLAGGIAHDFNNQLTGIIGFADLLKYELRYNYKLSRYVDNILTASRRSSDLTNKLLAFARKGKYLSVETDIHRIIMEVISLLQHSIDKRIELYEIFKANSSFTEGDPTQIQNAILNLALNARDAMPEGGTLTFETKNVEFDEEYSSSKAEQITPGKYIEISVTDTGTGMTDEVRGRVYEPFFTTKDVGKGTGLGMSAVYGTVKSHKGIINIDSGLHKGTTVKIYLPVILPSYEVIQHEIAENSALCGKLRLILVDDEDVVCELGKEMLEMSGNTVQICRNGSEAVEYYRKNFQETDLVILDMIMPKMGGVETFFAMKEINPDVKVLLSSGYTMTGETQMLLENGAKGFVQKPFTVEELNKKIAGIFLKDLNFSADE